MASEAAVRAAEKITQEIADRQREFPFLPVDGVKRIVLENIAPLLAAKDAEVAKLREELRLALAPAVAEVCLRPNKWELTRERDALAAEVERLKNAEKIGEHHMSLHMAECARTEVLEQQVAELRRVIQEAVQRIVERPLAPGTYIGRTTELMKLHDAALKEPANDA